ncbi:LOW QUALITY PROTEIN: uncharacterized protein [Asterias amurensis]|uniref:LOW QUALITY PROTEIN: uncharacterized protein n=1 Tax=Asterias amurensis TaxID=7602 RepID=UPI003AB5E312
MLQVTLTVWTRPRIRFTFLDQQDKCTMNRIMSLHCVFRATAVLLLSGLSTFPIVVSALDGYVEPGRSGEPVFVEQGTDLHLNCTLSNVTQPGDQTAVDIVWYRGSQAVPTDWYSAISDSVSQLSLMNVTFDQSSSYSCGFQEDDFLAKIWVEVLIGTKPEPVKLECTIRSPDEYRCNWVETTNTNLRTTHHFQFRIFNDDNWRECPCPTCEPYACFIGIAHNSGIRQEVRVTTTNPLGEAVTTLSFDPYNDVVVNPPRDVMVTALLTETSLKITWFLPDEWHRITNLLEYRLQYKKAGCQTNLTFGCMEQVVDVGRTIILEYILQGLEPYTEYAIQLGARYGLDEKNWSEWTPEETVYTRQTSPSGIVGNLTAHEENTPGHPFFRDVNLVWKELEVQNQNGIILEYKIEAVKTEASENQEVLFWSSTRTWFTISRLSKYFPYQIKVAAVNQAGPGPWASVQIWDETATPAAPNWVQATALTTTSINVTWGAPSEPNGIIQSYIVQWRKSDEKWRSYMTLNAARHYHVLDHLDTYVLYEVTVRARNSLGVGEVALVEGGSRTLQGVPGAAPSGLTVKPINDQPDSLTLTWEPLPLNSINGDLQGYLIGYCQSESSCTGDFLQHKNLSSPDVTSKTLDGLEPSTQYSVWLAAYTSIGLGPESDHVLATTRNEASVVVVAAVLGPLLIAVIIVIVIVCVVRQVINSRSIPDPKIARDVDVMKMNSGMYHCQMEEEIFDNMPVDDSQTGHSHPLESVVIKDSKKQTFEFSRSESNDSGFPPSPARSSGNLDYLRDKLSIGDNNDSVFEEENGQIQKDMHKRNGGLTSRTSHSDSVGPYTMVGELPSFKIPASSGLGPPSMEGQYVAETTLKGSTTCRTGIPSSPSVDVSPYTQMSTVFTSCPASRSISETPAQQENQNRNKLSIVGLNNNQTTQIKEVSPYTLMSAMSSVPHRQPKRCQEPSVGASKCKKQTHHLGSSPTLSVHSQMLAMEAIKKDAGCHIQKSPPESPSTVSPYSKVEDLNPPSFSTNSSNNLTNSSTQPVSHYIQMPEVNFLTPRKPQTSESQQASPMTTTDVQTHKPLLVVPQPVSPYIQIPPVNPMQTKVPPSCAVESFTGKKPSDLTIPAATETLISDTAGSQPLDPLTKQQNGMSPNDSPSVFQQTLSPYIQAPGVNVLQQTRAKTDQPKQHAPDLPSINEDCPSSLHTLQQSSLPYIQKPRIEQTQHQSGYQGKLPPATNSAITPLDLSPPATPYILIPDINSLQLTTHQSQAANQDAYSNTDGQTAQQQIVSSQSNLQTPRTSQPDIIQQQNSSGATSRDTPVSPLSALPYDHMPQTKPIELNGCHVKKPEALLPAISCDSQTDNSSLILPQAVSPYIEIPETHTTQLAQQQVEQLLKESYSEGSTQLPLPLLSQTVSEQGGSHFDQEPQIASMQLSQQQATQPEDFQPVSPELASHIVPNPQQPGSSNFQFPETKTPQLTSQVKELAPGIENNAQSSQSVSPEPGSPYVQVPEPQTQPLVPQQASHSEELNSNSGSSKNQTQHPQSVSPKPGSPYVQVPEPGTLKLGPQQASHSEELNSNSGSSENQTQHPQSVSPEPVSPYVQVPEPGTQPLGPQQASHSEELNSSSASRENQTQSPQSVSPESGSLYVQNSEPDTLKLGPQQASHSEELNSSSGSSQNQTQHPQSASPAPGSPYVQVPEPETLKRGPQQASLSEGLNSSSGSSEHQTQYPQSVSPEPVSPYVQVPEPETLKLGPQQASHSEELNSSSGSSDNQTQHPQSASPAPGSSYVQVPEPETLKRGPQQASHSEELNSNSGSSKNQTQHPQSVSPKPGSPYVQVQEPGTLKLGPQASHSEELNSSSGSSENQTQHPQSVSPKPVSPYVQGPEPGTLQLGPQQASHSKELNSSSGSSDNQTQHPQSASPAPGSPYVQVPEPETLKQGPQQASLSEGLNSSSGSSENQTQYPQSVSPEPASPYVQVPEPETLKLGPQQASHSEELNSSSGSHENQTQNPKSVSPKPVSPYVQVPEPQTQPLVPQEASLSEELNSSSGSSENQTQHPHLVLPEPGWPYVQNPEPDTLKLSPQQARHSKELNSSSGSSENQTQHP